MAQWNPSEFQDAINSYLARRGWSQPDLARAAGISQAVVNRWLSQDPEMLVQPTDRTLRKLAPVVGISHGELMRLAGRLDGSSVEAKPAALVQLIADIEAGWHASDPVTRPIREDAVRSIFSVHLQRNRRIRRNKGPLDKPIVDYIYQDRRWPRLVPSAPTPLSIPRWGGQRRLCAV